MLFEQNSLQFLNAENFFTFKNDVPMFLNNSDDINVSNKSVTSLSTQSASGRIHNLWNIKSRLCVGTVQSALSVQSFTSLASCFSR
jgi:hypothetical protein